MPHPDPQLDIAYLAAFVQTCGYLRKSRRWHERLLLRLAQAHLDTLVQREIASGMAQKGKFQKMVKK